MYLVAAVYFLLMCNMAFGTIKFFFDKWDIQIGERD